MPSPAAKSVTSPYCPAYSRQVQPSSTRSASVICSKRTGMASLRRAAIRAISAYTGEPPCPFPYPLLTQPVTTFVNHAVNAT